MYLYFIFFSESSAQCLSPRNSLSNRLFSSKNAKFEKKQQNKLKRKKAKINVSFIQHNEKSDLDTTSYALYMNSVKQHGWMRGLGEPITEEQANHLYSYLRFSNKNKAGHWTKVENLNGYGKLENNSMGTYLVNPFDDNDGNIDSLWKEKLLSIVSWELVGDETGKNCIQENAYDKEGNLVYSYLPVKVSKDTYMGHYVDAWGIPAKFRNEHEAKYVVVKWDKNGYESEVSFIGDDGFPKKNSWGAYIAKYEHDKNGFTLSNMSCASDGTYMKDRFGNCGQKSVYDKFGNSVGTTNYDEHNKIMRVPINESSDADYVQQRCNFDKYGRTIKVAYFLEDGTPDTTRYGVHGYDIEYNERGQTTLIRNFDINERPKNHANGHCYIKREYDGNGNDVLFELRDENGLFFNNTSHCCLEYSKYNDGVCIEDKLYKTANGRDTVLTYHFYRKENVKVWKYIENDTKEITTYDEFGNEIEDAFYTLDDIPKLSINGFHKKKRIITYSAKKCKEEIWYRDINDGMVDLKNEDFKNYMMNNNSYVYNHSIEFTDTLNLTRRISYLDGNKILKQFEQPRSSDFIFPMGETALDIIGEKARSQYEQALYYQSYTGRSIKNGLAFIGGTNEYGEPGYILEHDGISSKAYVIRSNGVDFDEYGNPVKNSDILRDTLPQAFVIEITDTLAFKKWGIKSGDIIMKYGEWNYPIPNSEFYSKQSLFKTFFAERNILKDMVVMRRNPLTNEAEYRIIKLGTGLPKDFGFIIHRILYTQKEKKRYINCYQQIDKENLRTTHTKKHFAKNGFDILFMQTHKIDGYKNNIFGKGIKGDAIVLGLIVQNKNREYTMLEYEKLKNDFDKLRFSDDRICQKIWFTTDLKNVQELELEGNNSYWDANFFYANCDKRISKPCNKLYKIAKQEMEKLVKQEKNKWQEYQIEKYGEAYKAVDNDSIELLIGETTGNEGYMVKNGYKGKYIILEWCGWKCTESISEFEVVFDKFKNKKKNITLLPFHFVKQQDIFKDILTVKINKQILGLSLKTIKVPFVYFKEVILNKYRPINK